MNTFLILVTYKTRPGVREEFLNKIYASDIRDLLRLIEVGASCFNHYCVGCGVTQLNVLHNVHRRISLG